MGLLDCFEGEQSPSDYLDSLEEELGPPDCFEGELSPSDHLEEGLVPLDCFKLSPSDRLDLEFLIGRIEEYIELLLLLSGTSYSLLSTCTALTNSQTACYSLKKERRDKTSTINAYGDGQEND